ncbi:glycosyltransferase family 2 protein [Planomonospora sp. ID82291]|uniref:glycosyltransferase n=1 Tax=Planomonospora sp. ID82291 TaxID=2738136 RepID=UPI0018C40966|nr:glycosyltransferase family 2 protein [Planomonospora sp. ID82291]MBG0813050.1 glycosyltransferase family 2 protein [Planomonospora sp. ID82291]
MIAEIRATIDEVLTPGRLSSALVACAGFPRPAEAVGPQPSARVVDLDRPEETASPSASPGVVEGIALILRTPADLRRIVRSAPRLPSVRRLVVHVVEAPEWWHLPAPGENGFAVRALDSLRLARHGATGWIAEMHFRAAVPPAGLLSSMAGSLRSGPAGPGGPDGRTGPGGPDGRTGASPARTGATAGRVRERPIRPVDELSVNPVGFLSGPELGTADLLRRGDRWEAVLDGAPVVAFPEPPCRVTGVEVARLRPLRAVRVDWPALSGRPQRRAGREHAGPGPADGHGGHGEHDGHGLADLVVALAAAGVPLLVSRIPAGVRPVLGEGLALLLEAATPELLADDLRREEHSIALRRRALLTHGRRARASRPGISVLLATRRPEMVGFALSQIARQRLVDAEVVLAAHGFSAGEALRGAPGAGPYPVTVIEADAATPFGEVLNRAAARASGDHLAKWDDDDWYGPHHLADMHLARVYTGAEVTGTSAELFYLEELDTTVRHRWAVETWQDFVAGGTIFMPRDAFEAVGGFRPIRRTVDGQLLEAVRRAGGRIYQTHGLGFLLRRSRPDRHTWQEGTDWFLEQAVERWEGFRPPATVTG